MSQLKSRDLSFPLEIHFFDFEERGKYSIQQECIPVGCILPTRALTVVPICVCGGGGVEGEGEEINDLSLLGGGGKVTWSWGGGGGGPVQGGGGTVQRGGGPVQRVWSYPVQRHPPPPPPGPGHLPLRSGHLPAVTM